MRLSDRRMADLIVSEILDRVRREMGTYSRLNHRFGKAATAAAAGAATSVYLGGDTSYASPNFVNLTGTSISVNDEVLVVIDPMGTRYVDKKL